MREVVLTGGRTTEGVVKVGNTVRRPVGAHSSFVHRLLVHLKSVGFDEAPAFLGIDPQGRETLSYIEGFVPSDLGFWNDRVLAAAASLIRRYHDATASSALAGSEEVVCHNDLSPCNTVFVQGIPKYLIDFDAARPGSRLWDLAYAAWLWLDLGNDDISVDAQIRRLDLFLKAYGWDNFKTLIVAIIDRQRELAQQFRSQNNMHGAVWAERCRSWTTVALLQVSD